MTETEIEFAKEVAEINLPCGNVTLVDKEDFNFLSRWRWKYGHGGVTRWTSVEGKQFHVSMHREITNCPKGLEVDHINRNPLDNRRLNLRITNRLGNCMNTGPMEGKTSVFKGVHWHTKKKRWIAKIMKHGKRIQAGVFTDEVKAAEAYDQLAAEMFGEYAYLNFPNKAALDAVRATI